MKLKKRKLLTLLAIASVFLFVSCQKDDYTEIVGLCPIVVSTNPVNGATSVPLLNVITVSFNERMNPATLNATSFSLQDASAVAGTISYTDTTATFTPTSPLSPNTTYTGKVTTAAKSLKGNALQADYVWSFSTFQ